jgi:hypothetical protein
MTSTLITEELLQSLVKKYSDTFMSRFPKTHLTVCRTWTGLPPLDDVPQELWPIMQPPPVSGVFVNIGADYRIDINKNVTLPGQLMTFFHEYGHACYRREVNEPIDNIDALIRTETAALLRSLRLADEEGLSEIAYLAVDAARAAAPMDAVYQKTFDNVQADPLWIKYSQRSSD